MSLSGRTVWKSVLEFLCPVCEGKADDRLCLCNGIGLVDQREADLWLEACGEELVRVPPPPASMPTMCADCAFRKGSPEREDDYGVWLRIQESIDEGEQFFCHQGMHCTADGRYQPRQTDEKGRPVGHPVCAGWLAARARFERKAAAP